MKVFAVVVTYNRLSCLRKVVDKLENQSSRITKIVIVDNSSTDGTKEWLESLVADHFIVIRQENLGGAGGFHTGCKYAYEHGADWIWMMDDDIYPTDDCLENLLSWTNFSECIQAVRYTADNKYVKSESFLYPKLYHVFSPTNYCSFKNGKKYVSVNVGCFEGMFISRRVVRLIGFPDSRFFIAGDDLVYGYLASFYTNPILVSNAVMIRERKSDVFPPVSPMYMYYQVRNEYIVEETICDIFPSRMDKIARLFISLGRLFSFLILILYRYPNKYRYVSAVIRGYKDRFLRKIGNTY
ncbi:glycosyltransferase family 2 protein [Parabacteroides distasonis]|uniref:glycosyltransferase family 2 protein n=1 Tax=Parabacteroides distasonis TaxID=823 RepID=UPI001C38D1C2|nr:glycosyltransferase family 2 protein [Parabacteroides distasonis]MBV4225224.1 glycosyltransferase family 2 protein [Parabacteroides distasonis]